LTFLVLGEIYEGLQLMDWKIWAGVLVVLALLVIVLKASKAGANKERLRRIELMTENELIFWKMLVPAAAPNHVAPQVAMSALMDAQAGLTKSERASIRNRFDRQRVDFVLLNDIGKVVLLVELDDSSHRAERDNKRDVRTSSVGYKTLRVRRKDVQNVEDLRARLNGTIAENPSLAVDSGS
jgi:very-short-patch-repair endonuclease